MKKSQILLIFCVLFLLCALSGCIHIVPPEEHEEDTRTWTDRTTAATDPAETHTEPIVVTTSGEPVTQTTAEDDPHLATTAEEAFPNPADEGHTKRY